MNKREKYTNKMQLEAMVNSMKTNGDIACGFSQRAPADLKKFWEELALQLNGFGPPLKDAGGWRKVWTDYESGIKKKLSKNKQLLSGTGGGPYKEIPLTEIEEEVSTLLNLNTVVQGIANVSSFGVAQNPSPNVVSANCSEMEENIPPQETETDETMPQIISVPSVKPRPLKRKHEEGKADLLKKQIVIQENLSENVAASLEWIKEQHKENFDVMNDIKRALFTLSNEKKKQTRLLEQQLEEQKRHNDEMEMQKLNIQCDV